MVDVLGRYSNRTEQIKRVRRVTSLTRKTWADRPKPDEGNRRRVVFRLDEGELTQLVANYQSGVTSRQLVSR